MGSLLFAVSLVLGLVTCSKRPLGVAGGRGGAAGSRDDVGTGGGSAGGADGGTGGSGGVRDAGSGGAMGGSGGVAADPLRLLIFYTRWGTSYPQWFPAGSDRDFTMSAMMQALEPYASSSIVVSGLTNANATADASGAPMLRAAASTNGLSPDEAMTTLLTARPATRGNPAQGPSLDTVIGDCGGATGPPLRLAVGKFGYEDGAGISFDASGASIRGERDPHAAAMRVLGHDVTAPDPDGNIDANYPALGAAHMAVAVEALATTKACVVTLMWGDQVDPVWLGLNQLVHELSHTANSLYNAVATQNPIATSDDFQKVQSWYAQQFASLLDRMKATPLGDHTLLDRTVALWISESGSGSDHGGYYMPVVIASGAGKRLDLGRFLEVRPHAPPAGQLFLDPTVIARTQGDLLAALASLWGIASFGDPQITRQPLTEILLP